MISALCTTTHAAVTPGGTFSDKAIFVEAVGGETLAAAPGAGTLGAALVNDFDTTIASDASYELNPSAADATQIGLSSGRHLVLYNTRINDPGGNNRAEFQTNLTLAGSQLAVGRAQGYIRRAGGADEAVMSGGAIITVAADDDILTLETRRSDNNGDANLPRRTPGLTAIQLLKLENAWDYLNLERSANQTGVNNATFIDVAYDTINAGSSFGTAFSFSTTSGDITLNEAGLYLIFANTSVQKADNNTRTQYNQRFTLDGVEVAGSETTTYVRGNENTSNGVAAIGRIISATAGQVLNVEVNKEASIGTNGVIQGGETAITMVKLPSTAEYISLLDTPNQEVNDNPGPDPVTFATQVDASSSWFSHTGGGSTVTVNQDSDYLFFGTVFTTSDAANDTQDRIMPLHGWQIDGAGGPLAYGRGCQFNRDNQVRNSGSWGGAILGLTSTQTVELTTQALGNADQGAGSTIALQGLSIKSLKPSTDPLIVANSQLSVLVSTTGTVSTALLETIDADDAPADLTYTLTSAPTLGTLSNNGVALAVSGTFTQSDVDGGLITFDAGAAAGTDGFGFSVEDDSGSGIAATGSFVIGIGAATVVNNDSNSTNEDTVLTAVDAGADVLGNDSGTGLSVTNFDASSTMGAAVTVSGTGVINYDPTNAPAIQALDDGDVASDSFTYTVTDFAFAETVGTVDITLTGVNDDPLVVDDSASGTDLSGPSFNVLANDSDADANDTLTVVSIDGNPVGLSGLTILSSEEATVTINRDGSFTYDPTTSADIGTLANGATLVDTIAYGVSDGTATVTGTITITSAGAVGASNDVGLVAANTTGNINILNNDDLFGPAGTPTGGAVADFNASDAGNSSATWGNSALGADLIMEGAGTQSVLNTSLTGAPSGVAAAYDLSGTGSGAPTVSADSASNIYGSNISTTAATFEMVFRPDDLVGNEPLWGSGGNGTGSSLVLLDDQLIFTAGQGSVVLQVVGTLVSADYVHVLVTVDLATNTAELYINNSLADSSTAINITTGAPANLTDWSGSDGEGVGRSNGSTGGDVNIAPFLGSFGTVDIPDFNEVNDRFDGEIAVLRVYSGPVLDAAARAANFSAVFGVSSAPTLGDIVDLAGETTLVPGTTVVNLPSGATVKLEADGTLTYDPNGAFNDIASGLEATDTFTYTLSGSSFATATVTARISGTNTDPQVSIAANQTNVTEGGLAGFTLTAASAVGGDVTVNLSYSGTASDGADFTGQASRTITNGTDNVVLDLTTIVDNLFEGSVETIFVTIDSVTGPATLSEATTAGTLLDDGDAAPVYTIAGGGASTEGSVASFTVTASVASSVPVTVDLSYTGTADATDFNPIGQVTIPASTTSATVNPLVYDDGIADPGETIIATISSPTLGSIGVQDNATTTISDGAGTTVFFADFEGVNPLDTPGGTLLGTDAPSAANLGTATGHWANVLTVSSGGAAPGLVAEVGDARGDGVDTMFKQDRPANPAQGEICAVFDGAIDLSGGNTGTISFDLAQIRTLTTNKNSRIIGLDPTGKKSFELLINAANPGPGGKSLYHVDSVGALTQLSSFNTIPNSQDVSNTGGNGEAAQVNIRLGLTSTGYTVALDHPTIIGGVANPAFDGVPDLVTGELAYAGTASLVSKLVFQIAGSTSVDFNGGLSIDNVIAAGSSVTTREAWRLVYYGSTANSGPGADAATAANGETNLVNFALGLDPSVSVPAGGLNVDAATGEILALGPPKIWVDPLTGQFYLRHTRRADFAQVGLTIDDEFSRNDLSLPFETSVVAPEVIATGNSGGVAIEAVQTEFPLALPISGGKARYGRVNVSVGP